MENRACNKEAPGVHSQPGLSLQKTGWGPCLSLLHPTEHWAEPWVLGRARHREKAEAAPALRQHGRHAPNSPAGRVPQGRLCAAVPSPLVKRGHWGRGWGRDSGPDLRSATWSCAASGGPPSHVLCTHCPLFCADSSSSVSPGLCTHCFFPASRSWFFVIQVFSNVSPLTTVF